MLGSKNRDYKTGNRAVEANLNIHYKYMQQFIKEGLTKEDASKKAYDMITNNELTKEIKAEIKRLKNN